MTDAPTLPTREFEGLAIPTPGTYTVDTSHSELTFSVRHMMVSKVRGRFGAVQGTIVFAEDPLASSVSIDIDVASVDTHSPDRDAHLQRRLLRRRDLPDDHVPFHRCVRAPR